MKKIRTVSGDISPEQLGFTSMHDHTFIDMRTTADHMKSIMPSLPAEMTEFKMENFSFFKTGIFLLCPEMQKIDDLENMIKEFAFFKAMGGQTVVDPSPMLIREDIHKTVELAQRTGLNIVCATGLYMQSAIPQEYWEKGVHYYYNLFKNEVDNGVDGTDIRPGILKGAIGAGTETEKQIVEACIKISGETGMPVYVHTEPTTDTVMLEQLLNSLCEKYEVDHGRIQICHMDMRLCISVPVAEYMTNPAVDRTINLEPHKRLMDKGYTIGFDCWGMPSHNMYMFMPDNFERLKALITLLDLGYGDQIVLGNDFSAKLRWKMYGGDGCTCFIETGLNGLQTFGKQEYIQKLVFENPARILAF